MYKFFFKLFLFSAFIGLFAELTVRFLGIVDFPIYEANNEIGFIPESSQKGAFLNKNTWVFNELHMGAEAFTPVLDKKDILLVGDSIVMGGNSLDQKDKLGPQLQNSLTSKGILSQVWPISAGSWALPNELIWIQNNPETMRKIDYVVFVINSSDFTNQVSSWRCETTHPRQKPLIAIWYLINKYIIKPECADYPKNLKVPNRNLINDLREFQGIYGKKTQFILYPDLKENLDKALFDKRSESTINALKELGLNYSIINDADWSKNPDIYYRDGIHPTAKGYNRLSQILANEIVKYQSSVK